MSAEQIGALQDALTELRREVDRLSGRMAAIEGDSEPDDER